MRFSHDDHVIMTRCASSQQFSASHAGLAVAGARIYHLSIVITRRRPRRLDLGAAHRARRHQRAWVYYLTRIYSHYRRRLRRFDLGVAHRARRRQRVAVEPAACGEARTCISPLTAYAWHAAPQAYRRFTGRERRSRLPPLAPASGWSAARRASRRSAMEARVRGSASASGSRLASDHRRGGGEGPRIGRRVLIPPRLRSPQELAGS